MKPDAKYAYREATVRCASQVGLIVIMYDMIIQDLQHAIRSIQQSDVEQRTREIRHALSVLEQLQGSLDMAGGGAAARNLDRWYSIARAKLLEAHLKVSVEILKAQLTLFSDLRDAWQQTEQLPLAENNATQVAPAILAPNLNPEIEHHAANWTA